MNAWSNDEEKPGKDLNEIDPEGQWNQMICSRIAQLGRARAGVHNFYPHTRTGIRTWVVWRKLKAPRASASSQNNSEQASVPPSPQHSSENLNRSLLRSETFHDSSQSLDKSQFHSLLSASLSSLFSNTLTGNSNNSRPQAHQILYHFLNTPCACVDPWFMFSFPLDCPTHRSLSVSSLKGSSSIPTFFLEHPLTSPTPSPPPLVLPQTFKPLAYIDFSSKQVRTFACQALWRKLVGDTDNTIDLKILIKYLECARHCARSWGVIGCSLLRIASSDFESKLYHIIRLGLISKINLSGTTIIYIYLL